MKRLQVATIGTILVFGAFAGMAMLSPVYAGDSDDPSHFTYARVYCTPDGETHFQNVTVELGQNRIAPPAAPIYVGGNLPASNAYFAGFEPGWGARDLENRLNHPAPAAQFVTVVHGAFSIQRPCADRPPCRYVDARVGRACLPGRQRRAPGTQWTTTRWLSDPARRYR